MATVRRDGEAAADALNEYWDALVRPGSDVTLASLVESVDPGLSEAVRRVSARDDTPSPSPRFVAGLWSDLLAPRRPEPVRQPRRPPPAQRAPIERVARSRRPLVELVVAAILVVAFAGGLTDGLLPPPFVSGSPTAFAHEAALPLVELGCASMSTPEPDRLVGAQVVVPPSPRLDDDLPVTRSADGCADLDVTNACPSTVEPPGMAGGSTRGDRTTGGGKGDTDCPPFVRGARDVPAGNTQAAARRIQSVALATTRWRTAAPGVMRRMLATIRSRWVSTSADTTPGGA